MKDKNGQNIVPESLISIKSANRVKYYYVTGCSPSEEEGYNSFTGYRVNKDFSINLHDRKKVLVACFYICLEMK